MVKDVLIVSAGGALGAASRYLVFVAAARLLGPGFPYGTLIVNVAGSFAMGILLELMALVWNTPMQTRLFLAVGFLGAFTTFSTFSLDVAFLYERKAFGLTAIYILGSVVLSIGAFFAATWLVRRLVV